MLVSRKSLPNNNQEKVTHMKLVCLIWSAI